MSLPSCRNTRFAKAATVIVASLVMLPALPLAGQTAAEWTHWGADASSTRYSPLDQIDASNFGDLEVQWIWRGDNYSPEADPLLRATPIYVNGMLYSVAGSRRTAVAIDAATGETIWTFREAPTKRWEDSMRKNYGKGVAYHDGVIYLVTPAFFLHALDADTGLPVESFGHKGTVDLLDDLGPWEHDREDGLPPEVGYITNSSPPIVVNGTIIVGNSHEQGYYQTRKENVPGNILAYDAETGAHKWTFNVIPQEGEFGHETWESDAWSYTGNVSAWAPMSADPDLGMVYVVTDPPTIDYFGGFHPGDNLFATSILALDIETGERRWHFQTVHHDVWNYDNPTAPNLVDITVDGVDIPALVQTTKQGWAYVFNRETGEPVWPIEEREVPQSDVPGEQALPDPALRDQARAIRDAGHHRRRPDRLHARAEGRGVGDRIQLPAGSPVQSALDRGCRRRHRSLHPLPGSQRWRQHPRRRGGGSRNGHPLRGLDQGMQRSPADSRNGRGPRVQRPMGQRRSWRRAGPRRAPDLQAALRHHHGHRPEHRRAHLADPQRGHARRHQEPSPAPGRGPAEHGIPLPRDQAGDANPPDVRRGPGRGSDLPGRGQDDR